jgi:hypothetical protein
MTMSDIGSATLYDATTMGSSLDIYTLANERDGIHTRATNLLAVRAVAYETFLACPAMLERDADTTAVA